MNRAQSLAFLSLVLLWVCLGCSSTEIVDPGPPDAAWEAQEGQSFIDSLPLTIDEDRPWWQKTLFWAGPGH